jgi:hypothetical protein
MTMGGMVGAGLRVEGRQFIAYLHAQVAQHVVQHMVMAVAHPARADLQRHVTIAQVITGACQQGGIVARRGGNRFRGGAHLHHQSIVTAQAIAVPQDLTAFQEQRGLLAEAPNIGR